ncbi:MAG: isocitrate lyase/phosphoenolpyruvate mutase family protein [Acidimicrobiia bacterium]|nr:isocitrate lyase/phosphoenolpyruvate mutase family protein [Acidimicrobiia bacterium]
MDGNRIRELLNGGTTVLMPGVWDALSSRLTAQAGFEVSFVSGYASAATLLGLPDFGYLTQTEIAEIARRVCTAAPQMAVVVDGDTGHGNPLNTIRTVDLFERAGAAGVFLEDQVWPKKCGHMAGKRVVPRDEWLAKLKAAVDHRDKLFVVARTDARAAVGIDEACERARAARDLGVDAIFVEAPESIAELEQVAAAVPDTVRVANMIEAGKTPLLTPKELHDLGYDLIVSPLTGLLAATRAMATAYQTLRERGSLRDDLDLVLTFDEFNRVVELDRHYGLEAQYVEQEESDPSA